MNIRHEFGRILLEDANKGAQAWVEYTEDDGFVDIRAIHVDPAFDENELVGRLTDEVARYARARGAAARPSFAHAVHRPEGRTKA